LYFKNIGEIMELYDTDYVLVDINSQKPVESYNIINHYTSVIDEYNMKLLENKVEYVPMTSLSKEEQNKYIENRRD
tara:strand:+ start:1349 stop:1576 length:228 start_codon:yes stop_codon:yes gene_type:complete